MDARQPGRRRAVSGPPRRDGTPPREPSPPLIALQGAIGNRAVTALLRARQPRTRELARQPTTTRQGAQTTTSTGTFPWRGEISARYNAALRRGPHKNPDDPYRDIEADLDAGTAVTVTGEERGWLHVEVTVDGHTLTGYVSHELVRYVGPVQATPPSDPIGVIDMSWGAAMVMVKRAQNRRAAFPDWTPTGDEARELDQAIARLEHLAGYTVDHGTYAVTFTAPSTGKIVIRSIEDFILFVEAVEQQYPQAPPADIAGELRQIWFGGSNWEALLHGRGVIDAGKAVDIEHEPDPIAVRFDIPALKTTGQKLDTRLGVVDVWHVLAGIDAALNGTALEADQHDDDARLKWQTLHTADAGDPRDFVTWSGDLGQAYAEYLLARYVKNDASARLLAFVEAKASPEQLLGDIHGYIATEVYSATPIPARTGWGMVGQDMTVSNLLRTLYLVDKTGGPAAGTYEGYMAAASGKSKDDLPPFVVQRALAFARPWYAKVAEEYRGRIGSLLDRPGLSKKSILEGLMAEFDELHAKNERTTGLNRFDEAIAKFAGLLGGDVR